MSPTLPPIPRPTAAHPLAPVVAMWQNKILLAIERKGRRFQKDADEGMKFFTGPYDWLYERHGKRADRHFKEEFDDEDDNEIPAPRFQMTSNRVAELVQIFGPVLYHRNPTRQVNPREYPLPDEDLMASFGQNPAMQLYLSQLYQQGTQAQAVDKTRSRLLEHYLNYTPGALDLKRQSRWAIDEALIKGMGCLWTEVYTPPGGGQKMVGSFFDSVDNLQVDPDATSLETAKWIARRRVEPVWECERRFGFPQGYLQAQYESYGRQAEVNASLDGPYLRATGQTADTITYWEVYSKCGVGGRLSGIAPELVPTLEAFGDFCYLAICPTCPHPLNVPQQLFDQPDQAGMQGIMSAVQWQTPHWADDAWPFTPIAFHHIPNDPWPMSHLAPGMGELKFLNWAYSFIAGKIRISCRNLVAVLEEAGQEMVDAIVKGSDYEIIRLKGSSGKTIDQVIQFLKHPDFNGDIWRVIEAIAEQFDKRVGLTELMYGMQSRQDRSATESQVKHDQMTVRPDEMANKVEDAMSAVARQEAIACRWHLKGQDVTPVMGPVGAAMWDQFLTPANPGELLYQLEYRIEAGSVRKPNRERDANNAQQLFQQLSQPYFQLAMQVGLVGPFNSLLQQYCKSLDIKSDTILIPAPQPPQPGPQQQPAGGGHQQQNPQGQ